MDLRQESRSTTQRVLFVLSVGLLPGMAEAELFISEYVEGSGFNKAIEIYNPGSTPVNLSSYEVQRFANGNTTPTTETLALSGILAAGDVYVIANAGAGGAVLAAADATDDVISFNGDDAVALLNGGAFVDVIGQIGFDPGLEWTSGGVSTRNQTLRRKSDVCAGDTDGFDTFAPDTQWNGFPEDTFEGLGAHSVTCTGGPGPGPQLVISEIMFNPSSSEDDWEWVEVFNAGSATVDLAGYVLDDANTLALGAANIASGSIPAGGSAILFNADDLSIGEFEAAWGSGINLIPVSNWEGGSLNNGGDTVGLWTDFASYVGDNVTQARALVSVTYPNIDDGSGSVYLTDLTDDSSWALSSVGAATPVGTAYQSVAAGGNSGADVGSPEASGPPVATRRLIHEVQGSGASSPLDGQMVTIEAVVTGDFQSADQLNGFFLQEEDADQDADPLTSEGLFVSAPGAIDVAEGDLVSVTGMAAEFGAVTQINSVTDLTVLSSGNALPSAGSIDLPVPTSVNIDDYFEPLEGMRVQFVDPLYVSEYFQLARYGEVLLTEGGRVSQFTSTQPPDPALYLDYLDNFARRQIILDDDNNIENAPLPDGVIFHPQPGGFAVGLQGVNYFRGGDVVSGLAGILDYTRGAWRVRPTAAAPVAFALTNPRPGSPEPVAGRIKVATFNVLNYFTTIDDGTSTCGPLGIRCRGADSPAELTRQRDKIVSALAAIEADIVGLVELENNASASLQSVVDGLNLVVGAGTYAYVDAGVIGTDAIKVGLIYKPATVTPAGSFAVLDRVGFVDPNGTGTPRNRPALAQTFEENSSGANLTVVVNHLKSKGSPCGPGDDSPDDGQGNCNGTRTAAMADLAAWLATDPTASGDPDFLILGDLNAYAKEDPISALASAGYTDLIAQFLGETAYGFVFDGQLGYLDHALANTSLASQVTATTIWNINADEVNVFDYNDDIQDPSEPPFQQKPGGNPLYQPDAFRSSDHDPVVLGLNLDAPVSSLPGDIDLDGDVDINDIQLILAERNLPASGPDDPRDLDGDGIITVLDARKAVLLCTLPRCAPL